MPRRIKYVICYGFKGGRGGKLFYDGKNTYEAIRDKIKELHPDEQLLGYGYKRRPKLSKKMKLHIKAIDDMLGGVQTISFGKGTEGISEGVYRNIWLKETSNLNPGLLVGEL